MWHVVRKTKINKLKEETKSVKAFNCLDWCEVNASSLYVGKIFG
jgi:hypothetical protein